MRVLSPQQKAFFEAFGYLKLPGLIRAECLALAESFEAVFREEGAAHDGSRRSCIVPFIDRHAELCALLDHPGIDGALCELLGEEYNYLTSDGNCYTGDTNWHADGQRRRLTCVKLAFYLDPVRRESGCLRVLPGSHRLSADPSWAARQAAQARELWGLDPREVPCVALESDPGDVLAFDHNLMHASFGGSARRRMFTINACNRASSPESLAELRAFIGEQARFWIEHLHSDLMKATAGPGRMKHLKQVMENEDHLPALVAQAKARMKEASRG
ncbi:MAG: phytanoyl-CoA dioxygenase family protein [Planctomycetota bacterium]|nr:phytanoyl-CoA dioxygenase family protein [Planctomycetota bacterium]